ncbi:MAG TPA: ABC transporter ATP-binding protein [Longimicrobiaceae bacterium]|nr:ABC transporter ATP-binding protein [Longimicrobiaceae bacterium]
MTGLRVRFGEFQALGGVSLAVQPGEVVVLLGANGAGKSTLFRAISGLVRPSAGSIRFAGREIGGRPAHEVVRAGIAHGPEGKHLFPGLSVRKNLLLGGYPHRRDREGVRRSLEEVHALFPVLREKADAPAGSLSGGQQQMVVIGRALMARPRLLLLDEPSLGLAPLVVQEVLDAIRELNRRGTAVLLAEQNAYAALRIADRGYVIENGEVRVSGPRAELMDNPEVRRAYLGV